MPFVIGVALAGVAASTFVPQWSARSETDACALLTPAQVSAAVGFPVAEGKHVTQTFVKTCTWTGAGGSGVLTVTLNLQTAAFFDGAKKQAGLMAAAGAGIKSAGVGDDRYYFVAGPQVDLWVKKGGNACKITVYKQMPIEQKQAIELSLAKQVVPKL
jgi:hypothetical protein